MMRKRTRQHHQVQRSNEADPFLFWGSLITLGFLMFTLFLGFNALEDIPTHGSSDVVNKPLAAGEEGSIDDRCAPGQSLITNREGIAEADNGSYRLGAVTQCQ
tara:strand:- start:495 stop:803 length:309 start_codon:yes stop_codon:yes gene_type:complete